MNLYEIRLSFNTDRPLTETELDELYERLLLEIEEPVTRTDEVGNMSISTDASWSGKNIGYGIEITEF